MNKMTVEVSEMEIGIENGIETTKATTTDRGRVNTTLGSPDESLIRPFAGHACV